MNSNPGTFHASATAYTLSAQWAAAVGQRGADGPLTLPAIGSTWTELRTLQQAEVLAALGEHAMWARRLVRLQQATLPPAAVGAYVAHADLCSVARAAHDALLADPENGSPAPPWEMPGCQHCAAGLARLLLSAAHMAWLALGFRDAQIEILATEIAEFGGADKLLYPVSVPAQGGSDD